MRMNRPLRLLLMVPAVAASAPLAACTLCYSRTAAEVRSGVLNADFLWNVAALLAPLPVLWLAVMFVRRISP